MDYNQKYKEITSGILKCVEPLDSKYSNLSGFEKCILALRLNNYTYGDIQLKLGMPAKKLIREVLLKVNPELINTEQIKKLRTTPELRIKGILEANNIWEFDLDEFGESIFEIKDGDLWFTDEYGFKSKVKGLDERSQKSILKNISDILHLGIEI